MAALDSNALSLTDYAKLSSDPKVQGIAWSLVQHNAILQDIRWINTKSLKATGSRWENLPGTNWVNLNEELTTQDGAPVQHDESVFIMRNTIKTDDAMRSDANRITDPHIERVNAYLRSRSYEFNRVFINNDPSQAGGNEKALVGLRARLDNPATYKVKSSNKIGSGGTFTAAATAQNYLGVLEKIDDLLDAVGDLEGNGVVLYCNKAFLKRFNSLSRIHSGVGGFSRGQDQYDRFTFRYRGAILRDVGTASDQVTQIISSAEPADGGYGAANTCTSIYAVNHARLSGLMNSLRVEELAPQEGYLHRTMIEMICGIFPHTNDAFGRLHGIDLG